MTLSGRVRLTAELAGPANDLSMHASFSAAPLTVDQDGKPCLTATNATATLESRGQGPRTGRVTAAAGKLRDLHVENFLADWSWDKTTGALLLAPVAAADGSTAAPVAIDVSEKGGPAAGKGLCDALEGGLRQLLTLSSRPRTE